MIQILHALTMARGQTGVKPTEYRNKQNVIRDGRTKRIVYMPREAQDVKDLMTEMVTWIQDHSHFSCPGWQESLITNSPRIHPYYDGNGRTESLLATLILHLGSYDLKGIYSLDKYYARNLGTYDEAINVGKSQNYYIERAEADIIKWVE